MSIWPLCDDVDRNPCAGLCSMPWVDHVLFSFILLGAGAGVGGWVGLLLRLCTLHIYKNFIKSEQKKRVVIEVWTIRANSNEFERTWFIHKFAWMALMNLTKFWQIRTKMKIFVLIWGSFSKLQTDKVGQNSTNFVEFDVYATWNCGGAGVQEDSRPYYRPPCTYWSRAQNSLVCWVSTTPGRA